MRTGLLLIVTTLLLVTSGCGSLKRWKSNGFKLGPDYRRPCAPVAPNWIAHDDPAVVSDAQPETDWWRAFNDPVLEHLIQTAYQQNLDLRTIGLRVLEARAQLEINALNLLPQSQTFSTRYARNQISLETANILPFFIDRFFSDWAGGFDMSWELDVWGRIRRSIESADASLDAEIENYDNVLVTLIGDVAATYLELRAFDERIDLAEQNVEIQSGSYRIAAAREAAGRVSELDVEQAKSNLGETKALVPTLRQGRRLSLNRLAILLGMTPYQLEPLLRERGEIPEVSDQVLVGIPAELLRRRPDVRAAERQVAAQSARIGIAEADLFPQFAIVGQIGLNSEQFSDLFVPFSGTGLISPGFTWKILNYGRLLRNIEVADLQFQQAVVNYQNVVLAAHREVEDALVDFVESRNRVRELRVSANAAEKSVELVNTQYAEGKVDFGRVFVLEAQLVRSQDFLVASEGDVATALVRVYKALGGGWQLRLDTPYTGCGPVEMAPMTEPPLDDGTPIELLPPQEPAEAADNDEQPSTDAIPPVLDPYDEDDPVTPPLDLERLPAAGED
ncbi:MAG: TolC family protein [Planctomycetota bacterium]